MHKVAARVWRRLSGRIQWRLLRLFHATFLISVSGVITRSGRDVLLLQHRYWPSGTWGLPGGYLRPAESLEQALVRELKEETGVHVAIDRLLSVRAGYRFRIEVCFLGRMTDEQPRPDGREALEARLFGVDTLPAGLL